MHVQNYSTAIYPIYLLLQLRQLQYHGIILLHSQVKHMLTAKEHTNHLMIYVSAPQIVYLRSKNHEKYPDPVMMGKISLR